MASVIKRLGFKQYRDFKMWAVKNHPDRLKNKNLNMSDAEYQRHNDEFKKVSNAARVYFKGNSPPRLYR
jgi:hypothetical protein